MPVDDTTETRTPDSHPRARLAAELLVGLAGVGLLVWAERADRPWFEMHAMTWYCAETHAQLVRASAARAAGGLAGLTILLAVRPMVGRWAGRQSVGSAMRSMARIAASMVLALVVSEGLLRIFPPLLVPAVFHYEPDSEPDARYSWRPLAAHVTEMRIGDRTVRFAVDADDNRVRALDDVVDPTKPTILSTGESVAAGFGLPYEETYPSMIAEQVGVQVVNVAVQGYASDAAYLRLVDALPRFERPIATVTMVMPLAIARNMARDRSHLVPKGDGAFLSEPRSDRTLFGQSRLLSLLERTVGYDFAEAVRRERAVITATARDSQARGAFPLFVLLRWPTCLPDETHGPWMERTLFGGLDVTHVRVDVARDAWDPVIRHPDLRGHRQIADAIVQALREHHVLAPASIR